MTTTSNPRSAPRSNPRSNQGQRPNRPGVQRPRRRFFARKKVCRFCADSKVKINYKNTDLLRIYLSERGKIVPRRISGNCAKHQREVTRAIKRSRNLALLPYVVAD
jgi:small subunit ribosomal protein S18